jgi:hypothetical protein
MQIGVVTVDGRQVGVISLTEGEYADPFVPNLDGYEPRGRASETPLGGTQEGHGAPETRPHAHPRQERHDAPHGHHRQPAERPSEERREHGVQEDHSSKTERLPDRGREPGARLGTGTTDEAIREAAKAHHLDRNTMRAIASIESGMNPSSNARKSTQYKGLYQIGKEEWGRFGSGNIYSAKDNAFAAARMFEANKNKFQEHFHRAPTDAELYMLHQQGLGFYTKGAMTNVKGNPYPGMRGPQTHASFEAGWGRELERRKAAFAKTEQTDAVTEAAKP